MAEEARIIKKEKLDTIFKDFKVSLRARPQAFSFLFLCFFF